MPDKKRIISCDALIVGGGIAGTAAAVSAARAGARVVLVEKNAYLGGAIVGAMHQELCGLYGSRRPFAPSETIHGGFADELCAALKKTEIRQMGRVFVLAADYDDIAALLNKLVRSEKRIRLLRAAAGKAESSDGVVQQVSVRTAKEVLRIRPQAVIDASGNNAVMRCLGLRGIHESARERQLGGFSVRLSGISTGAELLHIKVPYWLVKGTDGKVFPGYCRFIRFLPGKRPQEGILKMSFPDTESPQAARRLARVVHRFLSSVLPELRQSRLTGFSTNVFPRQAERFRGSYTLTGGDVRHGRRFKDAAARGAWPSEFWDRERGPQYHYVEKGHYEIPKRCLCSARFENLFAAGSMISTDPLAHASVRVSGISLASGEAAGKLAVQYLSHNRYCR